MNSGFKRISKINYSIAAVFLLLSMLGNLFGISGAWLNERVEDIAGVFTFHTVSEEPEGSGTEQDPYVVENFFHFNKMLEEPDSYFELSGDLSPSSPGFNVIAGPLANDGAGWDPVGYGSENRFTGHFNGNGHTISGLYINRPLTDNVGLFGHIGVSDTSTATIIENIFLKDVTIIGNRGVGALVGRVTGNSNTVIRNSGVIGGTVAGSGAVGGLVGSNNSYQTQGAVDRNPRIETSFAMVEVIAERPETGPEARAFEKFGGLVGCSQKGTVADSYAISTVVIKDDDADRIGGLAGCNIFNGRIARSYSASIVVLEQEALSSTNIGVLVGNSDTAQGNIVALSNNYYATDISDNDAVLGAGNYATDPTGVTERTIANMQGLNVLTQSSKMNNLDDNLFKATDLYPIIKDYFEAEQLEGLGLEE